MGVKRNTRRDNTRLDVFRIRRRVGGYGVIAHCLFEQSGTFKNEFKKLGIEAYDYDIRNDYGETDYVIDLFSQIRGGVQRRAIYL